MFDAQRATRWQHLAGLVAANRPQGALAEEGRVWDCGPGRVRVRLLGEGVYSAEYSGVLGVHGFDELRGHVMSATVGARALLLDMTRTLATTLQVPAALPSAYPVSAAPGVVLCRASHLPMWELYARELSTRGVARVVFLDSERDLARRVLQALAPH